MCYSALECLPESTGPPQQQEEDPDTQNLSLARCPSHSDIHLEFPLLHVNQMSQQSASYLDNLYQWTLGPAYL